MRYEHCPSYHASWEVIFVQDEIHGSLQKQNANEVVVAVHAFVELKTVKVHLLFKEASNHGEMFLPLFDRGSIYKENRWISNHVESRRIDTELHEWSFTD